MPASEPSPHQAGAARHDLVVIGGGASGMLAAIAAARRGRRVLICEKSPSLGRKLLASGGQRCNLSNTLSGEEFMQRVGREGRFMGPALEVLGGPKLREFFHAIDVPTVVHDGFRVWPETRKSSTVLAGLERELRRLEVELALGCEVRTAEFTGEEFLITHSLGESRAHELIIATGGLALPRSGACGDGYDLAAGFGHQVTTPYPAGVPLITAEDWPARCTAHTIGKARLQVALPKYARIARTGDLIFTRRGLRGPVVLDLSREIAPLLEKLGRVPLWMNLCRGKNQEDWRVIFKAWRRQPDAPLAERLGEQLPRELAEVLCELAGIPPSQGLLGLAGQARDRLIRLLDRTPITITASEGFEGAFVTRGGVRLKEVDPETLESKLQPGLYLCGEVLDLDGPCGGFNLQWAFASGFLAGAGPAARHAE